MKGHSLVTYSNLTSHLLETHIHSLMHGVNLTLHHTTHGERMGVRMGDSWTFRVLNHTPNRAGSKWSSDGSDGVDGVQQTVLVLPLEQFILNAFEKAPSRDKTRQREPKRTERSGRKKQSKHKDK